MKRFFWVAVAVSISNLYALPAFAATLTGRIQAAETVAEPEPLSVAVDGWACAPQGKVGDPRLRIGSARGLADVVVRLEGVSGAPPYRSAGPVVLDQKACAFVPHVVVVAPGQELLVKNSDPVLHNFHTFTQRNRTINRAQIKGKQDAFRFEMPEIIRVECDVHYWMSAVVVVADDAFTAVTGEDGTFSFDDVPAGEYPIELWHQQLGTQSGKVRVGEDGGVFALVWEPES